jgi:hypothetical protein
MWLTCGLSPAIQADTRILLDVSRSMAENDPENLRNQAIELLTDSLPSGEAAGLWTFGQYVNMLVPFRPVTPAWRQEIATKISAQNSPASRTNLGRALETTAFDFNYASYSGPTHIVLITDGRVDIAPNGEVNAVERERILNQLVPDYVRANARIHTIAMSAQADHALLKQMSDQTGGRYQRIDNPRDLTQALAELAPEVAPTNQLALQDKAFIVDPGVRELTVLMYHQAGAVTLRSPSGQTTSAVAPAEQRWRVGRGFTQVSITAPDVGQWQVAGDLAGNSSIRVRSDITLSWTAPLALTLAKGSPVELTAVLTDLQGQSLSPDLGSVIQATMRIDGRVIPVRIEQDRISAQLTPAPTATESSVELSVDGGTFNRLIKLQLRFVEPFVSEVLMTQGGYEWRLYPNRYLDSIDSIDALARYQQDGQTVSQPFVLQDGGYWLWQLPYDVVPDAYQVTLEGNLVDQGSIRMLATQTIDLMIPPERQTGMAMTPDTQDTMAPISDIAPMADSEAYLKDPMPEFAELQADRVVTQVDAGADWNDDPGQRQRQGPDSAQVDWLRYVLLSIPGLLVLVVAYLLYRRLEQKARGPDVEEDTLLGGDEFAGLDDVGTMGLDSDLDISSFDDPSGDDDNYPSDPPVIDDLVDEDWPTPTNTEAPTLAEEDMLDDAESFDEPELDEGLVPDTDDSDEELFDISSIDDDLADLDLALDGDDPFADALDDDKGR